ncbi:Cyclin-dependent kinase inhibitor 1 [Chelonia mydas]|uniref:Cyclin-dependent kinase inhibitor 1 n=1 Tax=Chelonia mydas TaxID=8469 RepID=M7C257_CHEMY|nr:Cyclin-dependent kinase inhibitor 1 [Chelonia mydas]
MEWRSVKANRVRRNLFGPVDHEQLQQDFQHMLRSSMEGAQQKWNFDFLRDMPAEGLLQWEELQSHDVPAFYHSCVVGEARKPLKPLNQGIVKEVKAHHFATVTLTENPKVAKKMSGKKSQAGKKRRQTSLTAQSTVDLTLGMSTLRVLRQHNHSTTVMLSTVMERGLLAQLQKMASRWKAGTRDIQPEVDIAFLTGPVIRTF